MPAARLKRTARAAERPRGIPTTRERILESAIALFNQYGVQNVAVDRIASELGISPGNLTYHFNRKDDLIRETLQVLKERLRVVLARPVEVDSPRAGAQYLMRLFRTFWDCRFFFNALAYLLTYDRDLLKDYSAFSEWVTQTMESDIVYLTEREYFRPLVPPNSYRLLAENIWSVLLNWLRMQQIESPSRTTPSKAALYDAALHLWSLCHLWMNPFFASELLRIFDELLSPPKRTQREA
jgi:AcrR family transcriptional regulator